MLILQFNAFHQRGALYYFILSAFLLPAFPFVAGAEDLEKWQGEHVFASPGNDARTYERTAGSDFADKSFQAEVTVTVNGGDGAGCAFFGLGSGEGDAQNYNEPSHQPAIYLRLAPSDFGGGQMVANVNGTESGHGSAPVGDGTHHAKMIWDATGRRALFDVDGKSSITVDGRDVHFGPAGHIFVGGANGVKFSNFSVKPLTEAEVSAAGFGQNFDHDPSAGTWLPQMPAVRDQMRLLACWYNGSKLAATREFIDGSVQTPGGHWAGEVKATGVVGEPEAQDLTATFKLTEGAAKSAGVAVAFDFGDWSTNNYVLIPASVYNGNRLRTISRGYNQGLEPGDYYRKDLPLTQTAVPRLAIEPDAPSKLEVAACNASTPAVCIFNPLKHRGLIILAEQAGRNGQGDFIRKGNGEIMDNAFSVEESADRSRAVVAVSAPGVREKKPEFVGFSASPDRGMDFKPGAEVTLHLRVYAFDTPDIPGLLEKFMSVRKAVTGPNHPRDLLPASQVEKWMTERIDSRFYNTPAVKFYCPENAPWIAFGWIGGWIDTFPMLALNDATHLERVSDTFDYGLKAQEASGYFHYAIDAKGSVTFRDPARDMNLARTSGDVLFWMIKQFRLLQAQGRGDAIKPEWETAMKKLADAMVTTWKKDGQWGKLINVKTGEVGEYNTTGGATIVGGLAMAADYFNEPEYLKVAQAAADFYYQRDFVKQGMTTGACADILQNAESETAAGFMTSLMTLYEITGDKTRLEQARQLANLLATWTISYDYELPKFTELGGLDARLAGAVWASTQNKHAAPGICTSSGDALFKIYRVTGDRRYAELMRDIVHAHGESIRPGGYTNERLTYCDADSRGSRGDSVTGWNEANGALMALELPGIYLQTDANKFYVFDSVAARVVKRDAGGVTFTVTNPTKYPARVSVFAETAAHAEKPLGCTACVHWPHLELAPGQSGTWRVAVTNDLKLESLALQSDK